MTSEVSAEGAAESRSVARIGPALIVASTLGSTLGIVIAQFLDDFGDGLLAELMGGDSVMYNNRVELTGASDLVWAGGFLLCLIVGFVSLFAYPTQRGQGIPRLTFLWMLLHVLRQGLGQAIVLPFDSEGQLGLAYATLDAPPGVDYVIAAAGVVGLLMIALSAASAFLAFTPHRRLVANRVRRFNLALWLVLIPAVASAFLVIPFFLPDTESLVINSLPFAAVMFLATVAAAPGTTSVRGPEDERLTSWPWGMGLSLVAILVFYTFVLAGGVSFDPRIWG